MMMFDDCKEAIRFVMKYQEIAFVVQKSNLSESKLLSSSERVLEHIGAKHGCLNLPKMYNDGDELKFYYLELNSIALIEILEKMGYSLEELERKSGAA